MPWLLYKFITIEILRVFAISLLVIVSVLSFGFIIPAVTDGVLGPVQLILLILYTMPLMLPYAAPVAIAFAVTINYFRMVNDNEVTACSALGISYRQLLAPVFVIGLVLMLILLFMSHLMIPFFAQQVTALIKQDIATFITTKLEKRQAVKMGGWVIYADGARSDYQLPPENEKGYRPYQRLSLHGVALSKVNGDEASDDLTADHVYIDLYEVNGETYASMVLRGVIAYNDQNGLINIGRANLNQVKMPSLFKKKINFYSFTEMQKLKENPDSYPVVGKYKERLIRVYSLHKSAKIIHQRLNQKHFPDGLKVRALNGDEYEIRAPAKGYTYLKNQTKFELIGLGNEPVKIIEKHEGKPVHYYQSEKVVLELEESTLTLDPNINVTMFNTNIYLPNDKGEPVQQLNQRSEMQLGRMYLPDGLAEGLNQRNSIELTKDLESQAERIPGMNKIKTSLIQQINILGKNIFHRMHARSAMSFICLFAALMAAIMAMHLRGSPPLVTFFWCFLPTIGAIVMVSGSKNLITGVDWPMWLNTLSIWGGVLMMLIIAGLVYNGLRKN